jgi:hypothetical protein
MKVLFAGPSLFGSGQAAHLVRSAGLIRQGPARQGDLLRAVVEGAVAIGLVDGVFETAPSVWHKEILYALKAGITVLGASSIGALRAAECQSFGMIGIGEIFQRYAAGALDDDAAVALTHAPADFDYAPLTEPLVNVEATVEDLLNRGRLTDTEANGILQSARHLHFKDRTYPRVLAALSVGANRQAALAEEIQRGAIDRKRIDAEQLVAALTTLPSRRQQVPVFPLPVTQTFRHVLVNMTSTADLTL